MGSIFLLLFVATAFAQLPLKSSWNGEGPMKYPKIMISNLKKFRTEHFKFCGSGLNIHNSCIETIDFTYYQEMAY